MGYVNGKGKGGRDKRLQHNIIEGKGVSFKDKEEYKRLMAYIIKISYRKM